MNFISLLYRYCVTYDVIIDHAPFRVPDYLNPHRRAYRMNDIDVIMINVSIEKLSSLVL